MRNFLPSILDELRWHAPEKTNGVCSRASETILHLSAFTSEVLITSDWLKSIGFTSVPGGMPTAIEYEVGGYLIETYPRDLKEDRQHERRWFVAGGKFPEVVHLPPRTRGEVFQLLKRLGIDDGQLAKLLEDEANDATQKANAKPSAIGDSNGLPGPVCGGGQVS